MTRKDKPEYCSLAWQRQCANDKCIKFVDRTNKKLHPVKVINLWSKECPFVEAKSG